jgi:hypothetical protein
MNVEHGAPAQSAVGPSSRTRRLEAADEKIRLCFQPQFEADDEGQGLSPQQRPIWPRILPGL